MVEPQRIELCFHALQARAMTTLAQVPYFLLVVLEGFEPSKVLILSQFTVPIRINPQNHLVDHQGIEPCRYALSELARL